VLLTYTVMILVAASCTSRTDQCETFGDLSPTSQLVPIRPGVALEVVDWCGEGDVLVFLAGLGHTAHVFDEFAPRFTDSYHVLGITRRGFGASSQPETGYTLDTLIDDLRLVLDSLRLGPPRRVILIGHSLGGDEMTGLAARYPDYVRALVYIEGAYDRVTTADTLSHYPVTETGSPPPEQTPDELASPEGYQRFYERVNGVKMPLGEIVAMFDWNNDGSYAGYSVPAGAYPGIRGSLRDPVYDAITAPALAIYAVGYPIEELFPDWAKADTASRSQMRAHYHAATRCDSLSRAHFRNAMTNGTIVEIPGAGHSLYITHGDTVAGVVRGWLESRPD